MIIKRQLQNVTWQYDTEKKEIRIIKVTEDKSSVGTVDSVLLSKVEIFSLNRFLIRAFQKMSQKQRKKGGVINES